MLIVCLERVQCRCLWSQRYFCQSEIENLRVSAFRNKNISGLDVPVNDSFGVRCVERIGDFDGNTQQLFQFDRATADMCFSVAPSRYSIAMNALPASSPMS